MLAAGAEKARDDRGRDARRRARARWASGRPDNPPTSPARIAGSGAFRGPVRTGTSSRLDRCHLTLSVCEPPSSSSTSTSSRGPSTCCWRSSCARRSACSRSSSGEIVLAYVEHLDEEGELDLEAATEFLVLIASLLELKSRLMLPAAEEEELELGPEEAADELLARMLEYRRYRDAGGAPVRPASPRARYLYRSAPLPPELRRVSLEAARPAYDPTRLGRALGDLLRTPPAPDTSHIRPTVSLETRLGAPARAARPARELRLRRGVRRRGPADPGGDDVRAARDAQEGRGDVGAAQTFGPITVTPPRRRRASEAGMPWLRASHRRARADRRGAAVPVAGAGPGRASWSRPARRARPRSSARSTCSPRSSPRAGAGSCCARSPAAGRSPPTRRRGRRPAPAGEAADAAADPGAGRDARDRRLPAAGLAARDRPDPRRQLGVGGADADRARADRGVRALALRRRRSTGRPRCSSGCSASPGSTGSPTRRASTRRPRTSPSCASACSRPASSAPD